jgi:PKD repeat protein
LTATNAGGSDTITRTNYITVNAAPVAPVAQFTAAPLSGNAPLSVQFTDQSTNSPAFWTWTFGDVGTSSTQNPSHSYSPGTYTVTLTARNVAGSDSETKIGYITANTPTPGSISNFNAWFTYDFLGDPVVYVSWTNVLWETVLSRF